MTRRTAAASAHEARNGDHDARSANVSILESNAEDARLKQESSILRAKLAEANERLRELSDQSRRVGESLARPCAGASTRRCRTLPPPARRGGAITRRHCCWYRRCPRRRGAASCCPGRAAPPGQAAGCGVGDRAGSGAGLTDRSPVTEAVQGARSAAAASRGDSATAASLAAPADADAARASVAVIRAAVARADRSARACGPQLNVAAGLLSSAANSPPSELHAAAAERGRALRQQIESAVERLAALRAEIGALPRCESLDGCP